MFFQQKKPRAGAQAKFFDEKILAEGEILTSSAFVKYRSLDGGFFGFEIQITQIGDFQKANGVQDQDNDENGRVVIFDGFPQGQAFPSQGPGEDQDQEPRMIC